MTTERQPYTYSKQIDPSTKAYLVVTPTDLEPQFTQLAVRELKVTFPDLQHGNWVIQMDVNNTEEDYRDSKSVHFMGIYYAAFEGGQVAFIHNRHNGYETHIMINDDDIDTENWEEDCESPALQAAMAIYPELRKSRHALVSKANNFSIRDAQVNDEAVIAMLHAMFPQIHEGLQAVMKAGQVIAEARESDDGATLIVDYGTKYRLLHDRVIEALMAC